MKKLLIVLSAWMMLLPAGLTAKETFGFVDLGNNFRNTDAKNASPFLKFRDKNSTVKGDAAVSVYEPGRYFDVLFSDIAQDTAEYGLSGGKYEKYSYKFGYNGIVNNSTFGARTPYALRGTTLVYGVGSGSGSGNSKNTDLDNWGTIDYSKENKNLYADVKYKLNENMYFGLDANKVASSGIAPRYRYGYQVIDEDTTNVALEGGFKSDIFFASLKGTLSKFEQNITTYKAYAEGINVDAYGTGKQGSYQLVNDPSNDSLTVELSSALYNLPLSTTVALNVTRTSSTSESNMSDGQPPGGYANYGAGTAPNPNLIAALLTGSGGDALATYKGDHTYLTGNVIVKSNPISSLNTTLYYKYLDKKNESTHFYSSAKGESENFAYDKKNMGLDVDYKLPLSTKISAGYGQLKIKREDRGDAAKTDDKVISVGLRNDALDFISGGEKYTNTKRESTMGDAATEGSGPTDSAYIERFNRRFDDTDKKEKRLTATADLAILSDLDVTLEYSSVKNDYDKTTIGRLSDDRSIIFGQVDYALFSWMNISAFYEREKVQYLSKQRAMGTGAGFSYDPGAAATATTYNYDITYDDKVATYGAALTMKFMDEKLKTTLGYEKQDGDGNLNNAIQAGGSTTEGQPISDFGDYVLTRIKARFDYEISRDVSAGLRYTYERSRWEDSMWKVQTDGSSYTYDSAYADVNYVAQEIFASASYRF